MTFFRYVFRFLTGFFLLLLVAIIIVAGASQFFSFGGNLLLRGANLLGKSQNLALQSPKITGNPLKGYSFDDLLLTWNNRPLFQAEHLEFSFSLRELFKGRLPLENLGMEGWSADLDLALAMPSSGSFMLSTRLLPHTISLDRGTLDLASQDYELLRIAAKVDEKNRLVLEECVALLGSPKPLPLFFRGIFSEEQEKFSLSEGELYLERSLPEREPDLFLSGDLFPRQKLSLLFSQLPLEKLEKTSIFREISTVPGVLRGALSGKTSLEGALPHSWNSEIHLSLSRGVLGGLFLSSLELEGTAASEGPLDILFRGKALSGGFLEGSLKSPGSPESNMELRFSGTSLDLSLGEEMDPRLASLSGILPSLEGNYLRKEEDSSGFLEFSGARGSYGDLSFEDFRGTCLLSGDRVQSSLKGLLEHLPLEGGGTLVLRKEEKPEMDLFLRSSGTPLHRLKSVLPSLEALQPEGNLAWEILLRGTPEDFSASATMHSEKIRIRGELLESPEASLIYEKDLLSLKKARLLWKDVLLEGEGTVEDLLSSQNMHLEVTALPRGNRWVRESLSPEILDFLSPGEGGKLSLSLRGTPRHFQGFLSGTLPSVRTPLGTTGKGSLEATFTSEELRLEKLHIPLQQGEITFRGPLKLSASGELYPSLEGHIRQIALDPLESSGIPLKGLLEGTLKVRGSGTKPELSFHLSSPELTFEEYTARKVSCGGSLSGESLYLQNLEALFWDGRVKLGGTLAPLGKNLELNLEGSFAEIDLMNTQDLLDPANIYLKGKGKGNFSIRGKLPFPEILAEIRSSRLFVNSLPFEDVTGTLNVSPREILLDPLVAHVGSSPLKASVKVLPQESWNTFFSARAEDLNLGDLLQNWELYPKEGPFFPEGNLAFQVEGSVEETLRGKGLVSASEIFAGEIHGEKLRLPFTFDSHSFTLKESDMSFYQGLLKGEGTLDYSKKPALWKARLWGEDIQIAPFLRDLYPLSGDISGKGTFDLTLKGPLNYIFMTSGEGNIRVREGAFSGFPQLGPLLAKSKKPELEFASLQVYFSVDGRTLYFVPGSRLTAPPGHTIYRYFAADGFLPFTGKPININCHTEVNAPAINAFLGAFAGFLETVFLADDITQLTNITKAVEDALLGGIFGSFNKTDFREISFSLKGTMEEPELADLSIATKQKAFFLDPQGKGKGDSDFQLSFSFPTGEGKKNSDDVSEQFKEQLLEQAIKQVLPLGN